MLTSSLLPETGPFSLPRFMRLTALGLAMLSLLPACSDDDADETEPVAVAPAKITVPQAALHPEGIQYDEARKHFLVSSRTKGQIGLVKDDSTYSVFANDPQLISTIGLHLDASRQRLFVAISDNGANTARTTPTTRGKLAAVAIYNSNTGSLIKYIDLGALSSTPTGNHFANDIAVDAQGNAYITDSMAPLIYKVDAQNNASVFLENELLRASSGFGLNGLVFHPDGYLLVAKSNDGALFKVPLNRPTDFTRVATVQGLSLVGADGLLLTDPRTLLLVSGSQSTVYRLTTTIDWASAVESGRFATGAVSPTTITRRNPSDAYVLYPYQNTSPRFAIVKTSF